MPVCSWFPAIKKSNAYLPTDWQGNHGGMYNFFINASIKSELNLIPSLDNLARIMGKEIHKYSRYRLYGHRLQGQIGYKANFGMVPISLF